ncbi:MAG: tetratricopeptide repeat protein [Acidimicrobiia bacterium]|nr:tetratricopeptide repeat protein [Acidimicrobiia bacterium]
MTRWLPLVLAVLGALVYANALSGPFLFDDENSIVRNPQIRQLWPLSEPLSPPRDTPVAGRPLVNLSFALNYAADGLDVGGYHAVNIAIHILAALTLFGIVHRTLRARHASPLHGNEGSLPTGAAFVCALVWMLHPLTTEPVNYLTQRTESLMALFYLLTLYCAIRGWTARAVASCAAGMLCKESMVTAPLMVVLYDRIFVFGSLREAWRARRGLYAGLAATWLVVAAVIATRPRTSVGFEGAATPWVYLLNQVELIARYLWLTIWPRPLVLDYGLPRPLTLGEVWPEALLVVALGVAAVVALVRWPRIGFLAAWFFITLGPTSSIVPIQTEVGAERRMYLPLMALVVLGVVGVIRLVPRKSTPGTLGTPGTIALAVVCVLLATGTILRNREYRSRLSIAQTIVDRWPSGRGYFLLGSELVDAGRNQEAMVALRASARDYPGGHFALGTELLAAGKMDEAIVELEEFLRLQPEGASAVPAHDMLGRAYVTRNDPERALQHFDVVLRAPDYPFRTEIQGYADQLRRLRDR